MIEPAGNAAFSFRVHRLQFQGFEQVHGWAVFGKLRRHQGPYRNPWASMAMECRDGGEWE
jgi:hypothetical protein